MIASSRYQELLRFVVDWTAAHDLPVPLPRELSAGVLGADAMGSVRVPNHAGDRQALRDQGRETLGVYRKLARTTLRNAIREQLPRTTKSLGEGRFRDACRAYLSGLARSHHLVDVAFEFAETLPDFCAAHSEIPAFVPDLARHELSAFAVGIAADDDVAVGQTGELDLTSRLRLSRASRVERYAFPVHTIALDALSCAPQPTCLLVYRDPACDVRHLVLSPLAADVIDALRAGETLGDAVTSGLSRAQAPLTEAVLNEISGLLADLAERKVLIEVLSP